MTFHFLGEVDIKSFPTSQKPLMATQTRGRSVDIDGESPFLTMVKRTLKVSERVRRETSSLVMVRPAERRNVWTPPVWLWLPALAEPLTGLETWLPELTANSKTMHSRIVCQERIICLGSTAYMPNLAKAAKTVKPIKAIKKKIYRVPLICETQFILLVAQLF